MATFQHLGKGFVFTLQVGRTFRRHFTVYIIFIKYSTAFYHHDILVRGLFHNEYNVKYVTKKEEINNKK